MEGPAKIGQPLARKNMAKVFKSRKPNERNGPVNPAPARIEAMNDQSGQLIGMRFVGTKEDRVQDVLLDDLDWEVLRLAANRRKRAKEKQRAAWMEEEDENGGLLDCDSYDNYE